MRPVALNGLSVGISLRRCHPKAALTENRRFLSLNSLYILTLQLWICSQWIKNFTLPPNGACSSPWSAGMTRPANKFRSNKLLYFYKVLRYKKYVLFRISLEPFFFLRISVIYISWQHGEHQSVPYQSFLSYHVKMLLRNVVAFLLCLYSCTVFESYDVSTFSTTFYYHFIWC